jgi:predicted nucleotide-binding protein
MNNEELIREIGEYEKTLVGILSRYDRKSHIKRDDDPLLRQIIHELIDLFNDALGKNSYSIQTVNEFYAGTANEFGRPSFKSVENIISVVRAALTRFKRNPELLDRKKAQENLAHRENIFIIHGRDEAKWRELKEIIRSEFRLNPIILQEQADAGCKTLIEKFEHYAETCSYAIAIFTPDDEVATGDETYLQARPNVIYEIGWFCGRLGRGAAMLLLKERTSLFTDFGGIVQKRFDRNVAERIIEMRKDLVAAGILQDV